MAPYLEIADIDHDGFLTSTNYIKDYIALVVSNVTFIVIYLMRIP
jgi:hypothetical protein